jgi:hypothetical protein
MKYINLSVILISFLVVGCATNPENLTDHFNPSVFVTRPLPKYEGMPHGAVCPLSDLKEFEKFIKNDYKKAQETNFSLGFFSANSDKALTPEFARKITAACGGDKYTAVYAPTKKGFYVMVDVYASPSLIKELVSIGGLAMPSNLQPSKGNSPRKPSNSAELLLNNSTL